MRDTVVNDNKRYLRFSPHDSHPSWLGYKDRYLFPAHEEIPSFFFIRKFNLYGDLFGEKQLAEWIAQEHYNNPEVIECKMEDASVRTSCLIKFASLIQRDGQVIVIPVNQGFLSYAQNLVCSLSNFGLHNIIYWSLDHNTHDSFLAKGQLSIFLPGFPEIEKAVSKEGLNENPIFFKQMLRYKPVVMAMILRAGFDCLFLDADSIVMGSFNHAFLSTSTDVFSNVVNPKTKELSTSVLFIRNSVNGVRFLNLWVELLEKTKHLEDLQALKRIVNGPLVRVYQHDEKPLEDGNIVLKLLDTKLFVDGSLVFVKHPETVSPLLLHTSPGLVNELDLFRWGLWYITNGKCSWKNPKSAFNLALAAK